MDYEPLLNAFGDEPDYWYKTSRGSTYAHLPGAQTVRNRSGENHSDTTTGMQDKSTKTLYADRKVVNALGSWLQDPFIATRLVPEMNEGKFTGYVLVQMAEDFHRPESKYGPELRYKEGQTVSRAPVSLTPSVGAHPIEIFGSSESPKGTRAPGIHFGNEITELHTDPKTLRAAPISSRGGGGGMGGSMTSKLNPLSLQNLYAEGGAVKMPSNYSVGSWKLI